jgi:methyltransferase-like protein
MLDLLRQALPSQGGSPVQTLLKSEAERLRQQPDGFLFHAYLDVVNTTLHFHEFVERASAAGLQYLGDAQTGLRWTPRFGDAIEQPLQRFAHDDLEREQLVDFLTDCASRYSLLCHASVALDGEPRCERLDDLFIAANLQLQRAGASWAPEQPVTCRSSTGAVVTAPSRLFNAAFALLAETGPTGLRISSLRAAIQTRLPHMPGEAWVQDLCQCYRAGWVEVHATAACYTTTVAERPRTTRWARRQAETSDHVTSLRHRLVPLGPLDRQLVRWLDGTHDVTNLDALAAEIGRQVAVLSMVDVLAVRASLSRLAAAAFFLADSAGRE